MSGMLDPSKRGSVLDLSHRIIEPSTAQRVAAEVDAGLRCGGCRRRIETGLEFGRMEFQTIRGSFAASVHRTFACGRDDCDYHKKVGAEAHWMRPASYRWLPMSAMNPKDRPGHVEDILLKHFERLGEPLSADRLKTIEGRNADRVDEALASLVNSGDVRVLDGEDESGAKLYALVPLDDEDTSPEEPAHDAETETPASEDGEADAG